MVLSIAVPLLVALVGLLMYALATNAKLVRIGEVLFFCGALVTLFTVAGGRVHF
jgi:hypothetical protein